MSKKKFSLLTTKSGLCSQSLKDLAEGLSTAVGRKVWRTTKINPERTQFKYGGAVDKLTQYSFFQNSGIPALEFTTNPGVVLGWLCEGFTVFGRKHLNSSCGKGIVVMGMHDDVDENCPVYTKYKKKKREFRVHIFKDSVVAVVEKKRKKGFEGQRDTKIRNLANGYVFVQNVENIPEGLEELALKASKVTSSDFKGVDIGYNEKNNELFVIEVNSAPGIAGSNVQKYIEEIVKHV